jgi:tRNA-Thr(GGU) m(6)t(6)A37 methyltransferase TsaA
MKKITYTPIGVIHSPFKKPSQMPIQAAGAAGIEGTVEIFPDCAEGLRDLEGFSHIILIYHFHMVNSYSLTVKPFLDENMRGVFATRAPTRPNPIGTSTVRLVKVEGNVLHVDNVDIVDGTPLLDIKPYVPDFDAPSAGSIGWLTGKTKAMQVKKSDRRFTT